MKVRNFRRDPIAFSFLHTVGCATELGADKLSDVVERTGYVKHQVSIPGHRLVAIRIQVD